MLPASTCQNLFPSQISQSSARVTQIPTDQTSLFIQADGVRSVLLSLFVKWTIMPGFFLRREVPKVPKSPPSDPRTRTSFSDECAPSPGFCAAPPLALAWQSSWPFPVLGVFALPRGLMEAGQVLCTFEKGTIGFAGQSLGSWSCTALSSNPGSRYRLQGKSFISFHLSARLLPAPLSRLPHSKPIRYSCA